jgi:3-oxoacyl-[acyl-carrier-protein] synthase-3
VSDVLAVNGQPAPEATATAPSPLLRGAAIAGIGVAVPAEVVTNQAVAERLGVSEEWIVARTGVRERRVAGPEETVVGYAAEAGRRALAATGAAAADVDLVLVATMSHERLAPIAAAPVATEIGTRGAGAIDLDVACAGFVSGLGVAAGMIEAGRAESVLLIGVDLLSRLTDRDDRKTAALFGDAAGSVLITATAPGAGRIGPVILGSDGARSELITCEREEALIRMNGHDTFRHAVDRLCESTVAACAAAETPLDEIEVFVYHQANARILVAVGERLGLDPARVVNCIDRYGNTSAASVPLALAKADEAGLLTDGSRVLLAAFGGGLTWAATVVEWGGSDA